MTSKHRFTCTDVDGDQIIHETSSVVCSDVVRSVYYYLLGCGYEKEVVLDAMAQIVSEYERDKDE